MSLVLLLLFLAATPQAPVRVARVANASEWPRVEWVPFAIPLSPGDLPPGGHVRIGGIPAPHFVIERNASGSPRRLIADVPLPVGPYTEQGYEVTFHPGPAPGAFVPPAIPAGAAVRVFVDGVEASLGPWTVVRETAARREHRAEGFANGVRVSVIVLSRSFQSHGEVSVVLANDALVRADASEASVGTATVRFTGGIFGLPRWAHAHDVRPSGPDGWEVLRGTTIGDGARWGTRFVWSSPAGDPLAAVAAMAASGYPLHGLPDPAWENATDAYGLWGSIDPAPAADADRALVETTAWTWLASCPNDQWDNGGAWRMDEGGSGPHFGWGLAPHIAADRSFSPAGLERALALAYVRLRRPDHYEGFRFWDWPGVELGGGWPSWTQDSPLRPQSATAQHFAGGKGWTGTNEAHTEVGLQHRAYQLTGDLVILDELLLSAHYAASVGPSGEGRAVARMTQRLATGTLVAPDPDRTYLVRALRIFLASAAAGAYPILPGSAPPAHAWSLYASIEYPGHANWLASLGAAPSEWFVFFPYSEAFLAGTVDRAFEIAGLELSGDRAVFRARAGDLLRRLSWTAGFADYLLPDGSSWLASGTAPGGNAGLWAFASAERFAAFDPEIAAVAAAIRATVPTAPPMWGAWNTGGWWDQQVWLWP